MGGVLPPPPPMGGAPSHPPLMGGVPPPPPPMGGLGVYAASETDNLADFGPSHSRVAPPTDGLSKLIALQSAEGYWLLDQHLASLIGHSVDELKGSIPAGCSDIVWGTVLALALLMKQFSSQQDEWELLANKAEFWLGSQQLPSTIESLKAMATNCI